MLTSGFKRPAVFMVNKLGDQLIALPAMRALAAIFPQGLQLFLGEGMLSFFYRDLPFSDTVRVWCNDDDKDRIDITRVAGSAERCDLFLCFPGHAVPSALELAHSLAASRTVGYSEIFDERVFCKSGVHNFDKLFALPQHLDPSLQFDRFCAPPVFSPAAESAASRYVSAKCRDWDRVLFLHPETLPEKTWPAERFAWVLERFLAERPEYGVIVASREPIDLGTHEGRVIHIGAHSGAHLELVLAVMRHADLFLGIDSCFLHAADLFRMPGLALFGPTSPRQFGFRLSPHGRHIAEESAEKSMDKIRPHRVLDALLDLAAIVGQGPRPPRVSCRYGTFSYLPTDIYIGRSLSVYGEYSEDEVAFLCSLLKPGDTVVEVGANIGAITVPMAKQIGESGKLHAVEPQPRLNHLLRRNVDECGVGTIVHVHECAFGANPGVVYCGMPDYERPGNFGAFELGRPLADGGTAITINTVDGLGLDRCFLLKIDAEGGEVGVIEGARRTIAACRPLLYVENDRESRSRSLIELIEHLGYRLWWHLTPLWNSNNFRQITENIFADIVSVNMLCVPREHSLPAGLRLSPVAGPDDDSRRAPISRTRVQHDSRL